MGSGKERTSALYILIRPWLTLDQLGTALMFHSWLECSANGPVFICRREEPQEEEDVTTAATAGFKTH